MAETVSFWLALSSSAAASPCLPLFSVHDFLLYETGSLPVVLCE